MRIVFYIIGALVVLVVLIAVIGACLPRDHVVTRRAIFRQTPAALFAAMSDFAALPTWRSGLKAVEMLPPREGQICFREVAGHRPITYRVLENIPAKKLVLKIDDENLPFGGTWTMEVTPEGQGAVVTMTENGEVKNVIFRFLSRFVIGHTATLDAYLRDLGKKFGEDVTPQ